MHIVVHIAASTQAYYRIVADGLTYRVGQNVSLLLIYQ